MAVAIPLLAGAAAGAVGAGVMTATMVSIGAGLVAGATGISAKVDRAAAKVFGRDAVKAFDIAGAVYGAFGGFSGQGPSEVWGNMTNAVGGGATGATSVVGPDFETATDASSAGAVNGLDAASDSAMSVDAMQAGVAGPGAMGGDVSGAQYQQQPWAGPAADPNSNSLDTRLSNGAARTPGVSAAPTGTGSQPGTLAKLWEGLGPQGKAMVVQTGGQMLAGAMQGRAQDAMLQAQEDARRRREEPLNIRWGKPSAASLAAYNDFYAGRR